jgi:hypothetical protein
MISNCNYPPSSFLPSFLPSFLHSFLPSFLPSTLCKTSPSSRVRGEKFTPHLGVRRSFVKKAKKSEPYSIVARVAVARIRIATFGAQLSQPSLRNCCRRLPDCNIWGPSSPSIVAQMLAETQLQHFGPSIPNPKDAVATLQKIYVASQPTDSNVTQLF